MGAYQVKHAFDSLFPLLMVYHTTKSRQNELPNHLHDWYEIVYVHDGTGVFFIDQIFYEITPGDLYVIPGNTIHHATPSRSEPYTITAVYFSPSVIYHQPLGESLAFLDVFKQSKDNHAYKVPLTGQEQSSIAGWLAEMHNELTNQMAGYRHASLLTLHQMLLYLSRTGKNREANQTDRHEVEGPAWMKEIMAYIDANFLHKLTLEHLAREALVSPSYFSRVFKQMTGMTLAFYLNSKRFIKAKELLSETDYTISQIAEECGFASLPNFYRSFKAYFGMTPADYRAKCKS